MLKDWVELDQKWWFDRTAYADYRVRGGGSDVPMVGIIMRKCACDDRDGSVDDRAVYVYVDVAVA